MAALYKQEAQRILDIKHRKLASNKRLKKLYDSTIELNAAFKSMKVIAPTCRTFLIRRNMASITLKHIMGGNMINRMLLNITVKTT